MNGGALEEVQQYSDYEALISREVKDNELVSVRFAIQCTTMNSSSSLTYLIVRYRDRFTNDSNITISLSFLLYFSDYYWKGKEGHHPVQKTLVATIRHSLSLPRFTFFGFGIFQNCIFYCNFYDKILNHCENENWRIRKLYLYTVYSCASEFATLAR